MHLHHIFAVFGFASLCACAQAPQVDTAFGTVDLDAPYPSLVPLAELTNGPATPARITAATEQTMTNRINALRARAARLNGPVVDGATRAQMRGAIARAALR